MVTPIKIVTHKTLSSTTRLGQARLGLNKRFMIGISNGLVMLLGLMVDVSFLTKASVFNSIKKSAVTSRLVRSTNSSLVFSLMFQGNTRKQV